MTAGTDVHRAGSQDTPVARIRRRRVHLYQNLALGRGRCRDLRQFQDIGRTEAAADDGLHAGIRNAPYSGGTYQMADDQARSWMVGGWSGGCGLPSVTATNSDQRGVGISSARR